MIPIDNTLPDVNADEILAALDTDTRAYLQAADQRRGQGPRRAATTTCARCSAGWARCTATSTQLNARGGQAPAQPGPADPQLRLHGRPPGQGGRRPGRRWSAAPTGCSAASRSEDAQHLRGGAAAAGHAGARPRPRCGKVRELGRGGRAGVRGAAPRGAPDRLGQPRAAPAGRDRASRCCASRCGRSCARRGPTCDDLRPAAAQPRPRPAPTCASRFFELNRFFNMAAYNPGGREGLTGDAAAGPARATRACCSGSAGWPTTPTRCSPPATPRARTAASSCSPPAPPTSRSCSSSWRRRRRWSRTVAGRAGPAGRHRPLPALMIKEAPSLGRMRP